MVTVTFCKLGLSTYQSSPEASLQTFRFRIESKCNNKKKGRVKCDPAHHGALVSRCLFSGQSLFQGHKGTVHISLHPDQNGVSPMPIIFADCEWQ